MQKADNFTFTPIHPDVQAALPFLKTGPSPTWEPGLDGDTVDII